MKIFFAVILISLCLASCAPKMHWVKQGYDPLQFKKDSFECERDATIIAQGSGYKAGSYIHGLYLEDAYKKCLGARGYEWVKE